MQNIIEQTKKKADAKAVCLELEMKIEELMKADDEADNEEMTDRHLMPPPSTVPKNKRSTRRSKFKSTSDEDEDSSDDSEEEADNVPIVRCKLKIDLVNIFCILYVYNYKKIQYYII